MTDIRPTAAQIAFLAKEQQHKRQVTILRILLLVLLCALWELSASLGILDRLHLQLSVQDCCLPLENDIGQKHLSSYGSHHI